MRFIAAVIIGLILISCKKENEVQTSYDFEIYSDNKVLYYEIYSDSKIVKKANSPVSKDINHNGFKFLYSGSYDSYGVNYDMIKVFITSATKNLSIKVKGRTFNLDDFDYEDSAFVIKY